MQNSAMNFIYFRQLDFSTPISVSKSFGTTDFSPNKTVFYYFR